MVSTVLHLSDTHFGTERPDVLQALLRLCRQLRPDLVVLSGDITQRARAEQFMAARKFLKRLARPLLVVPGNHDIPLFNLLDRVFTPYIHHCRAFGSDLEPSLSTDSLLVIGVNSTRRWRHVQGELSDDQIARVAKRLTQAMPQQLRLVVAHHPVAVTRPEDQKNLVRGHARAIRTWAEAGADLVLGGHIHLPYTAALHRRHEGLAQTMWAVQAGTAVSSRVRHGTRNSVNLIRHLPVQGPRRRVEVERWDLDVKGREFERASVEVLNIHPLAAR